MYGHADNQAIGLMPLAWFTGPEMYGQHLDYLNPFVRAQLLEMQRRKADFGADGLRIDGAQDFTYWSYEENDLIRDDDFMKEMSVVVQDVAGVSYRPWMIFEDGRPWPRDDWELASTYRAVTDLQPPVFPVDLVGVDPIGWRLAVAAPGLTSGAADDTTNEVALTDGTGAIWVRQPD